jgi:hypothetical protein
MLLKKMAVASAAVVTGATIAWTAQSGAERPWRTPPPPPAPTTSIYTVTALGVTPPGQFANNGAGGGEQVYCNPGDKSTGGGYNEEGLNGDATEIYVTASVAANSPNPQDPNNAIPDTGWIVEAFNNSPDTLYLYVYAQCLHVG